MNASGWFITLEGVEGAGKTTSIPYITDVLERHGYATELTREPGGTEVGEAIRHVLLSTELPAMHHDTELMLMFAARAEHIQQKIIPKRQQGVTVICDRFTDASYAYQGAGRGISMDRIAQLEQWVQGDLRPDLTLVFDVDAETGLSRAKGRGPTDRIEQENIDFFNRIRECYLQFAKDNPQRYRVIDARQSIEQVQQQIDTVLTDVLDAAK